jgi:hypothetical protein
LKGLPLIVRPVQAHVQGIPDSLCKQIRRARGKASDTVTLPKDLDKGKFGHTEGAERITVQATGFETIKLNGLLHLFHGNLLVFNTGTLTDLAKDGIVLDHDEIIVVAIL